jgi:hypothetical protein
MACGNEGRNLKFKKESNLLYARQYEEFYILEKRTAPFCIVTWRGMVISYLLIS